LLRQIPSISPIRAALLIALIQTPRRFRTKRQLWAYGGLAIETHDRKINPGKVFDLTLPLDKVAESYRAMDQRRAIKTLLHP
jgi:threonine dehydrogenase-like Zn-dependent dehydrogenase